MSLDSISVVRQPTPVACRQFTAFFPFRCRCHSPFMVCNARNFGISFYYYLFIYQPKMNVNLCNAMLIKSIELINGKYNLYTRIYSIVCVVHFVAFKLTQSSSLLTCTSRPHCDRLEHFSNTWTFHEERISVLSFLLRLSSSFQRVKRTSSNLIEKLLKRIDGLIKFVHMIKMTENKNQNKIFDRLLWISQSKYTSTSTHENVKQILNRSLHLMCVCIALHSVYTLS